MRYRFIIMATAFTLFVMLQIRAEGLVSQYVVSRTADNIAVIQMPRSAGWTPGTSREVNLKVRGIGLGSTLKDVHKNLGQPRFSKKRAILDTTCGPKQFSMELDYNGLDIELRRSVNEHFARVVAIEVNNSSWTIHRKIRIGIQESTVREVFGEPAEETANDQFHLLNYVNAGNDGFAVFYFKDGLLKKIVWKSNLC